MSAQLSAASLVAAGLLDSHRLNELAPRQQPQRPRRRLRARLAKHADR